MPLQSSTKPKSSVTSKLRLKKDNLQHCTAVLENSNYQTKITNSLSSLSESNYPFESRISTSLKSQKRSYFEAFAQSLFTSSSQRKRLTQGSKKLKITVSNQDKSAEATSSYITTQIATTSANINENNDKFTSCTTRRIAFEENRSIPLKKLQNCKSLISRSKTAAFEPSTTGASHISSTGSLIYKQNPFSIDFDSYIVLEKLAQKASNASNKRRYCRNTSPVSDSITEIDKEVLKRFLLLEEELREEILSSPPPQIPRLYRRSQSAFCQAREAAETQLIPTTTSPPPSYKRYHSWSNGSVGLHFSSDINPPRVSNIPSDFCFARSAGLTAFELNSNANAAPHNNFSSERDTNFFSTQSLKTSSLSTPFKHISQADVCFKNKLKEAYDLSSTTESVLAQFNLNRASEQPKQSSARYSPDRFPADKDIENLARLKVDNSKKSLDCLFCKKKTCSRNNSRQLESPPFVDGDKIGSNLSSRLLKPSHCFRSENCDDKSIPKEFFSFSPTVRNPVEKKKVSTVLNSVANYQRNLSLCKREGPGVLASLFAERRKKSDKKWLRCEEVPEKNNPFVESFTEYLIRSKKKHCIQSSSNNHNIREQIAFRSAENHNRKTNCGIQLPSKSTLPFHSRVNSDHLRYSSRCFSSQNDSSDVCYVQTDMGCVHSVSQKKRVEPCRSSIYSDVRATIDPSPTIIEEYSPIVLRYRTPYFRAHAQVIMPPIRNKETWTVGWIQACSYMKFINQYGNLGYSSWEIPALKANKVAAVSDSDGVSYPWYGNTTEIATIVGPTDSYTRMNLTMNDNFYPSVTWDIPVSEGTNAHLTEIVRDQTFITWLAAINETTKEIIILKTVNWSFYLEIRIDPSRKLGQRAQVVTPTIQNQPTVSNGAYEKHHVGSATKIRRRVANNSNSNCLNQIPITALVRPSANNAQTLIWRPTNSDPVVVVPPKEEHRDSNELVLFNGCSAMHGKEAIMREISRQELVQLQQLTR